jgi:hypothetical protein
VPYRDVAEIFKTPGKLRGKTPRTARRNPAEARIPLSDVFSTNSPVPNPVLNSKTNTTFQQALKNASNAAVKEKDAKSKQSKPVPAINKKNADSGYAGITDDDNSMQIDQENALPAMMDEDTENQPPQEPAEEERTFRKSDTYMSAAEYLSAKESLGSEPLPQDVEMVDANNTRPAQPGHAVSHAERSTFVIATSPSQRPTVSRMEELGEGSPFDTPGSPARALVRKSSLNFASLPARQPLNTKKSLGARVSNNGAALGRSTSGKSVGGTLQPLRDDFEDHMNLDDTVTLQNKTSTQSLAQKISMLGQTNVSRSTKTVNANNAAAHQPAAESESQSQLYPQLHLQSQSQIESSQTQPSQASFSTQLTGTTLRDEDDDDWIPAKPIVPTMNPARPAFNRAATDLVGMNEREPVIVRNASVATNQPRFDMATKFVDPIKPNTNVDVISAQYSSQPSKLANISRKAVPVESTTPLGSPVAKRIVETPLSAKEKLSSMMKSARGLFTSSGNASAKARELISSSKAQDTQFESAKEILAKPVAPEPRKTRSSSEREKEQRGRTEMESNLQRLRDQVRSQAANAHGITSNGNRPEPPKNDRPASPKKPASQEDDFAQIPSQAESEHEFLAEVQYLDIEPEQTRQPVTSATQRPSLAQQPRRPGEAKRPVRPMKDTTAKPKPAPVAILTASTISQMDMDQRKAQASLKSAEATVPTNTAPVSAPVAQAQSNKSANLKAKASAPNLHRSASNNSMIRSASAASTSRPKALIAAAKEKERVAEKEAQKKQEMERRRQADDERRKAEQRKEAERQRERARAPTADDPKTALYKQQMERRRIENAKKAEQSKQTIKAGMKPVLAKEFVSLFNIIV